MHPSKYFRFVGFSVPLVLWALTSSAQPLEQVQAGYRLIRLIYENTLGEKGTTLFFYNHSNRVCKGIWELADKSKSSENLYQHDNRGLLVSAYREFTDSMTSLEIYSYDERGNRIAERFWRSDGVHGTAAYTYDQNSRRTRARFAHHKGWLDADAVYAYDAHGLLRAATLLNDTDTVGRIAYDYDTAGNLAHETWVFNQGWTQTQTYEYASTACRLWDQPNPFVTNRCDLHVVSEEYTYNNEKGGPSIYTYARDGSLQRKEFRRSDGLMTVSTYTYDMEGRLIRSVCKSTEGSESQSSYAYDAMQRLILRTRESGGVVESVESYMHNPDGTLRKAVYQNVDGWLTGVLAFSSDQRRRLQRGVFKGNDGLTANIEFTYDREDCLCEVLWRFSSGSYQRYRFAYEHHTSDPGTPGI